MSNTSVGAARDHSNEIRRLSTLLEVSQALSGVLNLKAALQSVLDLLERRHQVVGGDGVPRSIRRRKRAARRGHGRHPAGRRSGPGPRPGDGITERVIDTGKPVVVPRVSQEPALAPPAGERSRGAPRAHYIAVPIVGRPAAGRDARGRAHLQARSRLPAIARVLPGRRLDDRAGGEGAAHGRSRRSKLDRGERAPARRAARALRVPQHHRQQRLDPAGLRAGRAGGADQHHGADPRRVGHRQGDDRARDPLQLAARQEAVHQGQLRGAARVADRIGAVRLRERGVHRGAGRQEGPVRAGRRRHALPRRDRRR